jgi:hypothetical protein
MSDLVYSGLLLLFLVVLIGIASGARMTTADVVQACKRVGQLPLETRITFVVSFVLLGMVWSGIALAWGFATAANGMGWAIGIFFFGVISAGYNTTAPHAHVSEMRVYSAMLMVLSIVWFGLGHLVAACWTFNGFYR